MGVWSRVTLVLRALFVLCWRGPSGSAVTLALRLRFAEGGQNGLCAEDSEGSVRGLEGTEPGREGDVDEDCGVDGEGVVLIGRRASM